MPRREKNNYHFIYKTTNLLNGKFYIGIHSTSNLEDGYLGSGKILKRSIKKYRIENFKIERLEFFEDKEKLFEREKEIVNESFIKNPSCMNLKLGGSGGFTKEQSHKGALKMNEKLWKDPQFIERNRKRQSILFSKLNKEGKSFQTNRKDKKSSEEHINNCKKTFKIINHQQGKKNSQYGTFWITNGKENKKINKEQIIPDGWKLGRKYK
jgi:hypothetical protein